MGKVIAVVNFKGGVGKSTIASILQTNIESSIVFNIDNQDAEKVNPGNTINVLNYLEEENATIEEIFNVVNQEFSTVLIDAPGELNEHLIQLLDKVDCFIIPFMDEQRVINTTKDTIKALFDKDISVTPQNVLLIHNSFTNDDDKDVSKEIIEEVKSDDNLSKEVMFDYAIFEHSKAIKSMTKKKKSISDLKKENFVAYKIIDNRVNKLMNKINSFIGE